MYPVYVLVRVKWYASVVEKWKPPCNEELPSLVCWLCERFSVQQTNPYCFHIRSMQILYIASIWWCRVPSRLHVWVRTDLCTYLMVVEMHTWSPDWKRVIIIIIIVIVQVPCMT